MSRDEELLQKEHFAVPVEGLETVLIQKRCTEPVDWYWGNSHLPVDKPFDTNWVDPESGKQYEHRALVTRHNAEAIIEKKNTHINLLKERLKEARQFTRDTLRNVRLIEEADNAALTARVKELENNLKSMKIEKNWEINDLKTQLAAAKETAAQAAYRACVETRHVTLGEKAAAAVSAALEVKQ